MQKNFHALFKAKICNFNLRANWRYTNRTKIGRHASSSTTTQCYIDFDGERLRDAVNKISGKTKDKQEYEEYLKTKRKNLKVKKRY